ncbi:MAG: DNA-binding protein [Oscillospiraceae bacterium]
MLLSAKQTGEKWGISARRVAILCKENRVPGTQRIGANWGIPEEATKPNDARITSGKYKKSTRPET